VVDPHEFFKWFAQPQKNLFGGGWLATLLEWIAKESHSCNFVFFVCLKMIDLRMSNTINLPYIPCVFSKLMCL
jgi:hypothetical protein